ncbi:hypothetical protein C8R43DRAFT_954938 [Mycena crocata]|nr:hypothetical protein C8R43DRAFT_954938 [Mycena crocata]
MDAPNAAGTWKASFNICSGGFAKIAAERWIQVRGGAVETQKGSSEVKRRPALTPKANFCCAEMSGRRKPDRFGHGSKLIAHANPAFCLDSRRFRLCLLNHSSDISGALYHVYIPPNPSEIQRGHQEIKERFNFNSEEPEDNIQASATSTSDTVLTSEQVKANINSVRVKVSRSSALIIANQMQKPSLFKNQTLFKTFNPQAVFKLQDEGCDTTFNLMPSNQCLCGAKLAFVDFKYNTDLGLHAFKMTTRLQNCGTNAPYAGTGHRAANHRSKTRQVRNLGLS